MNTHDGNGTRNYFDPTRNNTMNNEHAKNNESFFGEAVHHDGKKPLRTINRYTLSALLI